VNSKDKNLHLEGFVGIAKVVMYRHLLLASVVGLVAILTGCSNSVEPPDTKPEPYIVQVDCAQMEKLYYEEPEQFLTFYYSDKTISQEVRPGVCLQSELRKPVSP
jgi:hypothetical protein